MDFWIYSIYTYSKNELNLMPGLNITQKNKIYNDTSIKKICDGISKDILIKSLD
jgi:hypothetical protein